MNTFKPTRNQSKPTIHDINIGILLHMDIHVVLLYEQVKMTCNLVEFLAC